MTTVKDFYAKDFIKLPGVKHRSKCIPTSNNDEECAFKDQPLILDYNEKIAVLKNYGINTDNLNQEAKDYLIECPIFILKRGDVIVHSTNVEHILKFDVKIKKFKYNPEFDWWNSYFVGHSVYKGGWFTYKTSYGGPSFGLALYYRIQVDIPLLFIPNLLATKTEYGNLSQQMSVEHYKTTYSGSHIMVGPKNWKEKGYKELDNSYYADGLGIRLAELGFPGYISCDECEIFLTHSSQKNIDRPFKIIYEKYMATTCENCNKRTHYSSSYLSCNFCKKELKNVDFETVFNIMIKILCKDEEKCPLHIKEGLRGETIELSKVLPLDLLKTITPESFVELYNKTSYTNYDASKAKSYFYDPEEELRKSRNPRYKKLIEEFLLYHPGGYLNFSGIILDNLEWYIEQIKDKNPEDVNIFYTEYKNDINNFLLGNLNKEHILKLLNQ